MHRLFLIEIKPEFDRKKVAHQIETNAFYLKSCNNSIYDKHSKVVFALRTINNHKTMLFTSNRINNKILSSSYTDVESCPKIIKKNLYSLNEIKALSYLKSKNYYVFDLDYENSVLFVSLIPISEANSCENLIVLQIPSINDYLDLNNSNLVYKSNFCINTGLNPDELYNLHGKLAITEKLIFLTVGHQIIPTYKSPSKISNKLLQINESSTSNFGQILAIDRATGVAKIYATGFRAPSGVAIKRDLIDSVFMIDHGPRGGDELNLVEFGKNYGWPNYTHGLPYYSGNRNAEKGFQTGAPTPFKEPIYFWTPSIAPSGMIFLPESLGDIYNWARGDLVIGSLKAQSIFHIIILDGRVQNIEQIYIGQRIREIHFSGGKLFLSTDNGSIISLSPSHRKLSLGAFPVVYEDNSYYLNFKIVKTLVTRIDNMFFYLANQI
jgi:hypothetical protein